MGDYFEMKNEKFSNESVPILPEQLKNRLHISVY